MTTGAAIAKIIDTHERWAKFWPNAAGWSSPSADALLSGAAFRTHLSLARHLQRLIRRGHPDEHLARLLLGWVSLGSLVESVLTVFLAVHVGDYSASHQSVPATLKRSSPDENRLEHLKVYFNSVVWLPDQRKQFFPLVDLVQRRRNGVHSFQPRDLGTFRELRAAVRAYSALLGMLDGQMPYP